METSDWTESGGKNGLVQRTWSEADVTVRKTISEDHIWRVGEESWKLIIPGIHVRTDAKPGARVVSNDLSQSHTNETRCGDEDADEEEE